MILAGDIGGTKTVLALLEPGARTLTPVREETYSSRQSATFDAILGRFLDGSPSVSITSACFGVAGAVVDGRCSATNLPWQLEERHLMAAIPAPRVKLLNDLEAAAWGVINLPETELLTLQAGAPMKGHMAVIAAGTGLGEAIIFWDGQKYSVMASEGGHCDIAPRTEMEDDLVRYLRKKFGGHVSYERVLSGPGFFNIYSFLRDSGFAPESDALREKLKSGDASATVATEGLSGSDAICVKTLDLFASLYGAEAGNLALKVMAVGGVYIAGGIGPKLKDKLVDGTFMQAFCDKGRMSNLLKHTPVRLALNPKAPLLGAAYVASRAQ
jgi:glucokinase